MDKNYPIRFSAGKVNGYMGLNAPNMTHEMGYQKAKQECLVAFGEAVASIKALSYTEYCQHFANTKKQRQA